MAIDYAHYAGREPAFVKHTFLDKYLPALIQKVGARYDSFTFVDGFAGPWKSKSNTFEDTSFGIALKHMTAVKTSLAERGRNVRMQAILVEKDATAHSTLATAGNQFPQIDIKTRKGLVEDHVTEIVGIIPDTAFVFSLFDPKGFPDPARLSPLLKRAHSEALVNFMFDFANRFATTGLIPALGKWMEATGVSDWQAQIESLPAGEREQKFDALAREALRRIGNYNFAPSISVDRAAQDRTLYKLIYLSRSEEGLAVFRDSERKALVAQAESRSRAKAAYREARVQMAGLFPVGEDAVANDRSSVIMRSGEDRGRDLLLAELGKAGNHGKRWKTLWPPILNEAVVTRSVLGKLANEMRKEGAIQAPQWPSERKQIPDAEQLLKIA